MKYPTAALMLLLALSPSVGNALSCDAQKAEFFRLNQPLIVRNSNDARVYPLLEAPATERLHDYVDKQILEQLKDDLVLQPVNVVSRIECIQSLVPEYRKASEATNVPVASVLEPSKPVVAVGFDIYRGKPTAPSDRPYFEVFEKKGADWERIGEVGANFTGFTFNVHRIKAGKTGEAWFFLSGHRLEESGTRLRLAVAAYNGSSLTEIWSLPDLRGRWVSRISEEQIVLAGEENNDKGHAEDFEERFEIAPDGLKLSGKVVTKSY